ncbi:unnamed protein product [Ectocarpus fasciculatus]
MHLLWVKAFPFARVSMPLNPHATPFVVKGSGGGAAADAGGKVRAKTTSSSSPSTATTPKIFCDLDGCLVDFEKGCQAVMGETPDKLRANAMWRGLARAKGFYEHLDWMPDGRELWDGVAHLQPTILTGLPMGNWAEPQKRNWCKRELGEHVPVITCMSRDKHTYCRPGNILIDDRESLRAAWQRAGGVFIHHTATSSSLEKLKAILPAGEEAESGDQGNAKRQKNG